MNIFVLHPNQETSAMWLDDVRKNKMILESCQLLSTTVNILQPDHNLSVYKSSHINHPCSLWVRESHANFMWLLSYVKCLYEQRKGASHKSSELFPAFDKFSRRKKKFPQLEPTPFVNCAANASWGCSFKHLPNTFVAYRSYLSFRWSKTDPKTIGKPCWMYGSKPDWYIY